MTLQEFFNLLAANPSIVIFYFTALPLTAFLACMFAKDEGYLSPWRELFTGLLYMSAVPAIFAFLLTLYLFLFERRSILETDIYTQVLPMFSMAITVYIIRKNVELDQLPGFGKLSGLIWMILGILMILWMLDRTHIIAITILPFYWVILLIIALIVLIRLGWKRVSGTS